MHAADQHHRAACPGGPNGRGGGQAPGPRRSLRAVLVVLAARAVRPGHRDPPQDARRPCQDLPVLCSPRWVLAGGCPCGLFCCCQTTFVVAYARAGELEEAVQMSSNLPSSTVLEAAYTSALRRGEMHLAEVLLPALAERAAMRARGAAPGQAEPSASTADVLRVPTLVPSPQDIQVAKGVLEGRPGADFQSDDLALLAAQLRSQAGFFRGDPVAPMHR